MDKGKGLFIVEDSSLPVSDEGSLFIGWMEMRLRECVDAEDYEEAERFRRDILSAREAMVKL